MVNNPLRGDNQKGNAQLVRVRAIFVLLLVLGGATLLYGFLHLRSVILIAGSGGTSDNGYVEADEELIAEVLKLQKQDSDSDGLSDYDEEYIYGTSAYIADTDSDGFSDKDELDSNNDPLCPAGKDCGALTSPQTDTQDEEEFVQQPSETLEVNPDNPFGLPDEVLSDLNSLTPQQLRAILLESGGVNEEDLEGISDEMLMEVFKEALGQ